MKTLQLVLLDANVVIKLFELGLWERLLPLCSIIVSETVRGEAQFYRARDGSHQPINLDPYIARAEVRVASASSSAVDSFLAQFGREYTDQIDPGELESLVLLATAPPNSKVCSADGIVFKVLSLLDKAEAGISLQELLTAIGQNPRLPEHFTEDFRKRHAARGFADRVQGFGKKS